MAPKVSVIIPVYNTQEYLGQCLDTVLLQTLQDIEIICVDDGSTDDSLSTLQGYAFLDARLKIIHQENAGGGAARNRGLKEASGEYTIFLDSDDFFEADMLEKMLATAEQNNADIVACPNYVFDDEKKKIVQTTKIEKKYLKRSVWTPEELQEDLFTFCSPAPWNRLIRTEIIKKNNLQFDEKAHADDIMFTCLAMACAEKISMMENPFVYYRTNTPGQQSKNKKNPLNDITLTLTKLYEKLKELNLNETYLIAYIQRLRRSLQFELMDLDADKKRESLKSIRVNLPSEIWDRLFSSSTPAISIIVPVYNMASYLPECLESCLKQSLDNIEIICVDDGSQDNSLEILNQYAQKDQRIKIIHQENQGLAAARNTALEKATGRLIMCLDADDYLETDACECIYTYMYLFGLEMCSFAAIEFNDQTRKEYESPYHTVQWLPQHFTPVFDYHNLLSCLSRVAVTACLTCYQRSFLIKNQIQWISQRLFFEDTPFFIEALLKAERYGALPDKFYHRRVHPNAITQQMDHNFKDCVEIVKYTLNKILQINPEDQVLKSYTHILFAKTWLNFVRLLPEIQKEHAPKMYDLCVHVMKKYHYSPAADTLAWCLKYAKLKGKREFLKLKTRLFLEKLNRPDYTLNLFQFTREPEISFKILGLPLFQVQHIPMQLDEMELPLQKKVKKAEEIFYKICGLTFLKIEKKDLYG